MFNARHSGILCERLYNIWFVITALIQMTEIRSNFGLSKVWHTWTTAEWRDNQTGSNAINICVERGVGHFDQIPSNQRSRCLQFSRLILLLWFGSRNQSPLDGEPDSGYVPRIHIHVASEAH